MRHKFEWTPDCSGKWDYDGSIIQADTRYWPRGGSHTIFQGVNFVSDGSSPERQHIKPSAHASIYFMGDYEHPLMQEKFEGETEAEVKAAVEVWMDEKIGLIEKRLIPMLFN